MGQGNAVTTKKTAYLDALKERVLVFDGAMGTTLQTMNLTEADFGGKHLTGCNDCLVLNSPATIEKVHTAFL
jgi:5-methyltetrahydrofolate--homocysteine methyltransferase